MDSLQRLPDQTGDLGFRQQLVRHTVVKYLSACRTGKDTHTQRHTINAQIKPETDRPIRLPRGQKSQPVFQENSLKVGIHRSLMCWWGSAGLNRAVLARGDVDKLTRQKPHTSFLLLPLSICVSRSPGCSKALRLSLKCTAHSARLQFYCALDQQMQRCRFSRPPPLSSYISECNDANEAMKLFK